MKFCNKLVKTKKENKVALFVGSVDEILSSGTFVWYHLLAFSELFQVMSLTIILVIYAGSKGG